MLADSWRAAWSPPDRRPIYHWARENIYLPEGTYTQSGQFHVESSRWLIPIFDALQDDLTTFITVIAPPRTGKSLIPDVWIPSVIVRDPGTIQWLLQSGDVVKDYAESRIQPVLRNCPGIETIWPDDRHKASRLRVCFKNGCHLYISGPAIAKLQTKGVRYQVRDETWLWKPGRLKEADARLKDWLRIGAAKALTIGQASWWGDETCEMFHEATQSERFVRCPHCHHLQWPRFRGERPNGSPWGVRYDIPKDLTASSALTPHLGRILPTVRFECQNCGQPMDDSERTRSEWNRTSEYVHQNPNPRPGCLSFRASGTLFRPWRAMVADFISAMDAYALGAIEPLEAFIQKEIPDFFSDAAVFQADPVRKESYDIKSKWPAEDARFLTVDRQDEGENFAVIRAWSKTKGSRRLWRGRLYSEAEIAAKAKEFNVTQVGIDARWDSRNVYAMCIRHGWLALLGDKEQFFLHPQKNSQGRTIGYVRRSYSAPGQGDPEAGRDPRERSGPHASARRPGPRFAWFIRFSSDAMNARLQRLLDGRALPWIEPAEIPDPEEEETYRKHQRAEYRRKEFDKTTGRPRIKWVCPSRQNHYRDCNKMQTAMATIANVLPDELEPAPAPPPTSENQPHPD